MAQIREFAQIIEPISPGEIGEVAYERFESVLDCSLLPVIDGENRPVGLIERNSFMTKLASQYGRAVFGKRPVVLSMNAEPMLVDANVLAGEFAALALRNSSEQLLQGFIVTDEGNYVGVGSIVDLLKASVLASTQAADQLGVLAESLRASNLELERQRRIAEAVIEHIPSLITVSSKRNGRILLANSTGARILGVEKAAMVGRMVSELQPESLARQVRKATSVLHDLPPETARDLDFHRHDSDEASILRVRQIPIDMPGEGPLLLTVAEDVTEVRQAVSRIAELAHFDTLTGLPNRAQLHQKLDELLLAANGNKIRKAGQQVALLTIDLDRFKLINDTFGHDAGDSVLREMAARLSEVVRPGDLPARMGGDEFALVVTAPNAGHVAELIAARLIENLKRPVCLRDKIVHLGGSVGIALFPDDAGNTADLTKFADMALYQAKADGKGVWRRFCQSMRAGLEFRNVMELDLRRALELGQLETHFQPIFDISMQRISGFECLMRWRHPVHGLVPPSTFIPLAEEIGLICPLGEWMIRRACEMARQLPDDLTMAVNISAIQFRMPGLLACVMQALSRADMVPGRLELEITESVLIGDEQQVLQSISQLRELGVRIALDDFGTGFASFAYLQKFPFDKIKIDRSFIEKLPEDKSSRAIVSAVTILGKQLGAVVTAEGVETDVQLDCLVDLGCTEVQGFLIGAPSADPAGYLDRDSRFNSGTRPEDRRWASG